MAKNKKPKAKEVAGAKHPVISEAPNNPNGCIRFRFDLVDVGGPWCLSKISVEDHRSLLTKLKGFESMTMNEAFFRGEEPGKDYSDLERCPNPRTLQRLLEINREDIDRLSRLRLSNIQRLYGIRRGTEFSILWWDPFHEVWPSKKKHT